jgi:hypothetical protein
MGDVLETVMVGTVAASMVGAVDMAETTVTDVAVIITDEIQVVGAISTTAAHRT